VLPRISLGQISFVEPAWLWLLVVPGVLLVIWFWRLGARRADVRRLNRHRTLPVRERIGVAGDLPFWLAVTAAVAALILALARPVGPATLVRQGGIDLVILLDGSSSMRVADVPGNRWRRSMRFLFARIAAPQIRLTTDPNTFFFFLDHLSNESPFRLDDEASWDTNLERGIHWGLRLIERDEELHGRSSNAPLFVLLTDGETWSGEVEKSLARARERRVPVYVVGVGTLSGGRMPAFKGPTGEEERDPETPLISRLDREGLQRIAAEGLGQYYEIGRESDRRIANAIIDAGQRRAPSLGVTEQSEPRDWYFLCLAAGFAGVGLLFLREKTELALQLGAAVAVLAVLARVLW
jgi:Ca-activated chloride channel family protein